MNDLDFFAGTWDVRNRWRTDFLGLADITPDSARWEQAFSVDGEQTWVTNWIMEFTRSPG
jgi:hypothetical protein